VEKNKKEKWWQIMNIKSLAQGIEVYNFSEEVKVFKDLLSKMDESSWGKWGPFGNYAKLETEAFHGNPKNLYSKGLSLDQINKEFTDRYTELFKKASLDYINKYKIDKELSYINNSLCKYNPKKVKSTNLIMGFHTDFKQEQKDSPGIKHFLTVNFYLNDNYKGGDILFLTDNTDNYIRYKPVEGDMIIFPSTPPYYHAVRTLDEGQKYFVRSFWYLNHEGSKSWHAERLNYSDEDWKKKEDLRERIERNSYMKWMHVD
jgi:hypothetical protein